MGCGATAAKGQAHNEAHIEHDRVRRCQIVSQQDAGLGQRQALTRNPQQIGQNTLTDVAHIQRTGGKQWVRNDLKLLNPRLVGETPGPRRSMAVQNAHKCLSQQIGVCDKFAL